MNEKQQKEFLSAFDDLAPKLYRFSLLRVNSKPLAEDLVSQAFLKTWEYVQKGQVVQSYPVFLYRVVRNLIADHWRSKASRTISIELVSAETFVDHEQMPEEINNDIELKRIIKSLDKLPKDQREILHWRFVDGLSIKEIAELSGKKPNAVYVCIYRSVQKLKEVFKNYV